MKVNVNSLLHQPPRGGSCVMKSLSGTWRHHSQVLKTCCDAAADAHRNVNTVHLKLKGQLPNTVRTSAPALTERSIDTIPLHLVQ